MQHSFGFVSLGISAAYPEDSGVYTCLAKNRVGQAQTDARLDCQPKASLILGSQHQTALAPIHQLDSHLVHIGPMEQERPEELQSLQQPRFTTQLPARLDARQEQRVALECRVQPTNDPKLKIEW